MTAPAVVLDASALLSYLRDEQGAERVADVIASGAHMSAVNVGEVLSRASDRGADAAELASDLTSRGLFGGAMTIEPFLVADAIEVARTRPLTRAAGLSLGDRACLALARRLGASALTADLAWSGTDVEVEVVQIR